MKLPEQDNTFEYKFAKLKHSLKLRVLKIQLSNGDIEYLATNIFDPQITLDDFKWAYHKRWGIETKYNDVKNKLEIENFTGYSPDAILQDFYATMFLADLAGVLEYDLREEIEAAEPLYLQAERGNDHFRAEENGCRDAFDIFQTKTGAFVCAYGCSSLKGRCPGAP